MQVTHIHTNVREIIGQLLSSALGQRGHQHALAQVHTLARLLDQIIYLPLERLDGDLRINQACWPNNLFDHPASGPFDLALGRSRTDVKRLVLQLLKFLKIQRAIIEGTWQSKSMLHQYRFSGAIAGEHAFDLWHGGVGLIDHQQEVFRKKIKQCARPRSRRTAVQVTGIILDAGTKPHLHHHFQIVLRAHSDALGLEQLLLFFQFCNPLTQLIANCLGGALDVLHWRDELLARENNHTGQRLEHVPR